MKKAVSYLRTSSAANVGENKDSASRQRDAVQTYAEAYDIEIVKEFRDEAVSGADPVQNRPGFVGMLAFLAETGIKILLVENASRFARDLAVQIAGHDLLRDRGIELRPVDAPDYFTDETPTAVMVRQILGAVSEFEKANLVSKLRHARDKVRLEKGKCEGRKSYRETIPDAVQAAQTLREDGCTYREISVRLASMRILNEKGRQFGTSAIHSMLRQAAA